MKDLKQLFDIIKKTKFIENYTDIPKTNGILSRVMGTGTNKNDKKTQPDPNEMKKIKNGVLELGKKITEYGESI